MCEKLQNTPEVVGGVSLIVTGEPRISVGVENMFFSPCVNKKHLITAKGKLLDRIMEIDTDGSMWEILTEKECKKRHRKFLDKKESSTIICEKVGEHEMTYLFAIKGSNAVKVEEYQETLKWREVYSVL